MTESLRIAIADDHGLFRQGMRLLLELQPDVVVVGETDRVDGIEPMLAAAPCDILLLDLKMDRSALVEVATLAARTCVIIVTASENPEEALFAIRCGARAVVFKRYAVESLMDAIRAVQSGEVWMPPSLQTHLATGIGRPDASSLTTREREIVRHVALGLRNAEVGRRLFISEQTVKRHLNNVFQKLGVRDRVELALFAVRTGIIAADERAE